LRLLLLATGELGSAIFDDGELFTILLGEGDERLVTGTNDEGVTDTGGEGVTTDILDVDDIEGTGVLFSVDDGTDTTNVSTLGDEDEVTSFELGEASDLVGVEVEFNGVVDLDGGVRVTDGATIVGDDVGDGSGLTMGEGVAADDGLLTLGDTDDTAELAVGFITLNLGEDVVTLGVEEETEGLVGLLDADDVHETSRVVEFGADLVVNFDEAAHDDHHGFTTGEGVLQTVAEGNDEGEGFAELVGTSGGTGSPGTTELAQHPGLGSD